MDVNLINPFINATINVLETMAHIRCRVEKPYLKKDSVAKGAVTGVIGLTGAANGTVSVTFQRGSILKIVSSMFGEEITTVDGDVADAVVELTNMISGQARKELEKKGKIFEAAVPSVVSGKNHAVTHYSDDARIAIPFSTKGGGFTIEICLENMVE